MSLEIQDFISKFKESSELKVAWCSFKTNIITISTVRTQKKLASFPGAKLTSFPGYTYVEQIPKSNYLLSMHHYRAARARFEVFDLAKGAKLLYSSKAIEGGNIAHLLVLLILFYFFEQMSALEVIMLSMKERAS